MALPRIASLFRAAVALSCLVTTINSRAIQDSVAPPFNILLPPLPGDKDAATATTATTTIRTTPKPPTPQITTTTTSKPVALPELSIDLLPPLLDADANANAEASASTGHTNLKETKTTSTTKTKATTKFTAAKLSSATPPSLSLEALLPPLLESEVPGQTETSFSGTTTLKSSSFAKITTKRTTTTTAKPTTAPPPTLSLEALLPPLPDDEVDGGAEALPLATAESRAAATNFKKLHLIDRDVKLRYSPGPQVAGKAFSLQQQKLQQQKLQEQQKKSQKAKQKSKQHVDLFRLPSNVAKQTRRVDQLESLGSSHHVAAQRSAVQKQSFQQHNYRNQQENVRVRPDPLDWIQYYAPSTPRPTKHGLPTITPFPHRLRR